MIKKALLLTCSVISCQAISQTLPELNLNTKTITVSGLSSGGYMATQMHVAHSDWVKGAGIVAAGPYYCGQNNITTALALCVNKPSETLSVEPLNRQAEAWAEAGDIAKLDNLANSRVWLFRGSLDATIHQQVADTLHEQYSQWVNTDNLAYVNDKPFGHHFPTMDAGTVCSQSEAPFLGDCDYDAASEMLTYLFPEADAPDSEVTGKVVSFNQQKLGGDSASGLAETGYIFIPKACENGDKCEVHISFHGCNQYAEAVGQEYVLNSGINRWADDNNLVVLYPQTKKSLFMPLNPQGCWDWWGYTNEKYATRSGEQITAVKTMVENL